MDEEEELPPVPDEQNEPELPTDPVDDTGGWIDSPVSGARVDLHEGPLIAGDPSGARVEVREDGLHAFDSSNTETATVQGDGGEFVGGSFRTSDNLPGQVTISDTAYESDLVGGFTGPGIGITPTELTGLEINPGIGPTVNGLTIYGGQNTDGNSSFAQLNPTEFFATARVDGVRRGEVQTSPTASFMRTNYPDGTRAASIQASPAASFMRTNYPDGTIAGSIQASPTESFMRTARPDGTMAGEVRASLITSHMRSVHEDGMRGGWIVSSPTSAHVRVAGENGTNIARITASGDTVTLFSATGGGRYLKLNDTGIWIEVGGKAYNLEETAQDSGWQSFAPVSGMDSYALAWRNKGGIIYMRGTVTATWSAGWTTVATNLPAEMRPAVRVVRQAPSTSEQGLYFRMGNDGVLEFNKPTAGTRTGDLSAIFYPAD